MSLDNIYKSLNMTPENGLCIMRDNLWKGRMPRRLEFLIKDKLEPDAFFIFDKKPLILFYDSPKNREELFKAIWNFNETPVVIINEADSIEIYNGFSYIENKSTLEKLADHDHVTDFSYFELVTGKSLEHYQKKLKQQNRVDYLLLRNIQDARRELIEKYQIGDSLANALIGKCIFVRYLIDRGVKIEFEGKSRKWTNNEFCNLFDYKTKLIEFFKHLRTHFNGEAFLQDDNKLHDIPKKAFSVLKDLLQGTEIASRQRSLFDVYNFSIIPVEFISNVYEFFIGEENQAKKGAYYTPKFLVDYILTETVEKYFDRNSGQYNCKVLDPACGSGIFLVEALRRIIEQYLSLYNERVTKKVLKRLAEDNIFGIDKDENAVNVAIFSIYLALLDYQEPKEIENFKFPKLINKNFFTSDFFDLNADFNTVITKNNFNFIFGNPPWKRGSDKNSLFSKYIQDRQKSESCKTKTKQTIFSNKEIAQGFLLRTSEFSSVQTKCALIVTSKVLYNLNAEGFRKFFLHNYFVDKVLELAPVRREVFDRSNDPSIAPAAILFFHYAHGEITDKNIIEHVVLKPNRFFSLFKVFMLQRNDYKQIVQSRLKEYDWLWKTLVYGSYLDFNFIKRLEEDYKTISDIIYNTNDFLVKQGLKRKDGEKKINVKELIGWEFLDLNQKKQIEPFFIYPQLKRWEDKYVGYIYREKGKIEKKVFTPPVLLLKETVNTELKSIPVISLKRKILFTDKITSIKATGEKDLLSYYEIAGLLYSSLFSYFMLIKSSTVGIMIEQQVHDKEKFNFPYINNPKIAKHVERIEETIKKLFREKQKPLNPYVQTLEDEKKILIDNLNDEILNSFDLNEQERDLVNYAVNITIPLIMKHQGYEKDLFSPLKLKDPFLKNYAEVFLNRFQNSFERNNKKFAIKILHSNYIVGMFFKVTNEEKDKEQIAWESKSEKDLLLKLTSLGYQKITESLFIQKDIRGFERDGFYVIKPNEKKLWHKAIAYLDAEEFADTMLREGGKEKRDV